MKSTPVMQQQQQHHVPKSSEGLQGKVTKAKSRDVGNEEMHSLLAKLKDLVPNMPKNRKLSKLEIIQYVIDYIVDLQNALDTHPASRTTTGSSPATSPNRQPLGVLSTTGNSVVNSFTSQEVCQLDKIQGPLGELMVSLAPRSVSC